MKAFFGELILVWIVSTSIIIVASLILEGCGYHGFPTIGLLGGGL